MQNTANRSTLLALPLAWIAGGCLYAHAEGLRITHTPDSVTVSGTQESLRLKLSMGDNLMPGPLFNPRQTMLAHGDALEPALISQRGSLSADWIDTSTGLRSSLGIAWRRLPTSSSAASSLDSDPNLSTGTPFLSLGWHGRPLRNRAWTMSAEIGTYLNAPGKCEPAGYCAEAGRSAARAEADTGGVRWNPFISFGATIKY